MVRAAALAPIAGQVVRALVHPGVRGRAHPTSSAAFAATLTRDSIRPATRAAATPSPAWTCGRLLPAITAPTLVVAGSEDPATPPWHGAVIARAIPDARLRVICGAAHLASVSQPSEVTVALTSHLLAARAGSAGGQRRACRTSVRSSFRP